MYFIITKFMKTLEYYPEKILRKVIQNAIGKKPEKRYQTGKKMAEHLRVCLERIQASAGVKDEP